MTFVAHRLGVPIPTAEVILWKWTSFLPIDLDRRSSRSLVSPQRRRGSGREFTTDAPRSLDRA